MFGWFKKKPAVPAATLGPAAWRDDPHLRGRFHADYPDDLEVLVHDGEPRRTGRQNEKCWVRVTGASPGPTRRMIFNQQASPLSADAFRQKYDSTTMLVFRGSLLNAPVQLSTIRQGDELLFIAGAGLELPLRVTPQYIEERAAWSVQPCAMCGLGEGLDPPTIMARTRFPAEQGAVEMFTSFCPHGCKGQHLLFSKDQVGG